MILAEVGAATGEDVVPVGAGTAVVVVVGSGARVLLETGALVLLVSAGVLDVVESVGAGVGVETVGAGAVVFVRTGLVVSVPTIGESVLPAVPGARDPPSGEGLTVAGARLSSDGALLVTPVGETVVLPVGVGVAVGVGLGVAGA